MTTTLPAGSAPAGAPTTLPPLPVAVLVPPIVGCPGLSCLACGSPLGCQRLHPTAWAWAHLPPRPAGCPGLLVPPAGLVYLVHLVPAYRHARHYLGFTERAGVPSRLREHATSDPHGARLLRVALAAGGDFELTRLWLGTRRLERQLKQRKAAPRLLCPACPTPTRARCLTSGQGVLPNLGGGG
jgi:hypothetical protein